LIDRVTVKANGLRCLEGWSVPETIERRIYVVQGKPVADAYNDAAITALENAATFLLCVEDDHVIPQGTFDKLWANYQRHGPRAIVGAWYPQKKDPRSGAPIVIRDGKRTHLDDDGDLHEVYAIPQGFTLIPTQALREIRQPWFVTTGCVTQDSFFSQQAREAGWRLLVDSSARIKHVCRSTGRIYE
jgi:GT2 family glycosyltransferase